MRPALIPGSRNVAIGDVAVVRGLDLIFGTAEPYSYDAQSPTKRPTATIATAVTIARRRAELTLTHAFWCRLDARVPRLNEDAMQKAEFQMKCDLTLNKRVVGRVATGEAA
jgi:hypothetical protein